MQKNLTMTNPDDVEREDEEGDDGEESEEEVEGTPIEEAMEEILGCGTTCLSTILSPFLILLIMVFGPESQIAIKYNIREGDLVIYLLFGIVIAPFQVLMDILLNHAAEVKEGIRIYDYMLYAKYRWEHRLTRWLFEDPRMDESIAEPLQSVNHLCFSPQFYFIQTYYSWGILLLLMAVTILVNWNMNPFADPAFIVFVLQMMFINRTMDTSIHVIIQNFFWKPKSSGNFSTFSRSISLTLKRKDMVEQKDKYRQWF